jgi:H+-translocating NAD(P) transhydrogenase subunit beta
MNTMIDTLTRGDIILEFSYLLAAVFFVIGLKKLSHPDSARRGNLWAAAGMLLAMITTLFLHREGEPSETLKTGNLIIIIVAVGIGSVVGAVVARKVKMTAMPQLVSLFNASGGAASALVALIEFSNPGNQSTLVTLLGLVIGSIAFSGSVVAFGKLNGNIGDIFARWLSYVNLLFMAAVIGGVVLLMVTGAPTETQQLMVYGLLAIALIYGVSFVMPIGGADMPVVISLLNSLTGIAAAMAGFIYQNQAMILGGIFVGAAGMILTLLMCKAMNRSLLNVIIGAFGGGGAASDREVGAIKEVSVTDAAVLLTYSSKVVIVPGYGLAVAQAQHICSEMEKLLESNGVEVNYAIHPVAGRMPGHMNVLLAEADVPYDKLIEMDEINPDMPNTDVVVVIGANDVVNPAALDDPSSPIYGMPIIMAHEAKNIIVMKRGMGKGYAAIENYLFYDDKTRMLFGNAKDSLQKLVTEIKSL